MGIANLSQVLLPDCLQVDTDEVSNCIEVVIAEGFYNLDAQNTGWICKV